MTDPLDPTQPSQPVQPGATFPPSQPRPSDPFALGTPSGQPAFAAGGPPVAPLPNVAVRRQSSAATLVNVLLGVALVVAVGGVAFAAGRATAPAPVTTTRGTFGGGAGNGQFFGPGASGAPDRGGFGGFGGGAGGVSIQGTVTAITADAITLQLASGQTLTIPIDSQTTYHSRTAASASDVANGATVIVQLSGGGRGALNGGGNGQGNGGGPTGSGAPGRAFGSASRITVVPAGS